MSYGIAVDNRLLSDGPTGKGRQIMRKAMLDDDYWKIRMGRFSDSDEIEIKRLFRRKPGQGGRRSSCLGDRALAVRARTIDTGRQRNNGPEVIVKAVGTTKSRGGTHGMIRYVARLRQQDRHTGQYCLPRLYDEFGSHVESGKLKDKINQWGLPKNEQNISKVARALLEAGRIVDFNELKAKKRLHYIQSWHFVFSIVSDDMEADSKKLEDATLATIDSLFTSRGHKVLWGIHTDHDRHPHAHLIVKAQSEFGERLWFNSAGDYFDTMKAELVINLASVGLTFQASRREDRASTRLSIMCGEEPLRAGKTIIEYHKGPASLSFRTPAWFNQFGAASLVRRSRKIKEMPGRSKSGKGMKHWISGKVRELKISRDQRLTPDAYLPLLDETANLFSRPREALISWLNMAMEGAYRTTNGTSVYPNKKLADWYLTHQPATFGETNSVASGFEKNTRLRRLLKKVHLPGPWVFPDRADQAIHQITSPDIWMSRIHRDRIAVIASLIRIANISEERWETTCRSDKIRLLASRSLEIPLNNRFYNPYPANYPPTRPDIPFPDVVIGASPTANGTANESIRKNPALPTSSRTVRPGGRQR